MLHHTSGACRGRFHIPDLQDPICYQGDNKIDTVEDTKAAGGTIPLIDMPIIGHMNWLITCMSKTSEYTIFM